MNLNFLSVSLYSDLNSVFPLRSIEESMKTKVCIFEDDDTSREVLADIVMMLGYEAQAFSSPCEIGNESDINTIRHQADIVITDINMPLMSGTELVQRLIKGGMEIKNIAIISGLWSSETLGFARQFGIQIFSKPISVSMLMEWLQTRKTNRSISAQR